MRAMPFLIIVLAGFCTVAAAPSYAPPTQPAYQPAPEDAIPRPTLEAMYRAELGPLHTPAIAPKLYDAHRLIEQYFLVTGAKERHGIVASLEKLNIDANILGRITRLRMHWPALVPGIYYVNERIGPHDVIYFFGIPPGYDRTKAYPLVIKLPGAHPFVGDPPPTAEQVQDLYANWIRDELRAHGDAVVLMPLLNISELWGPSYKGVNSVLQPLLHIPSRVNIDPARIYLMGHAMSGHATWNLALHYPTYFSAIGAMAGGASMPFQRLRTISLGNVRSVVWHDADDPIVPVEASKGIVDALKKLKYDVDYEQTQGVGHAPTDEISERLYRKMRDKRRELYPKQVSLCSNRPDTLLNRNDWLQVWQMIDPGKEKKAWIAYGSGTIAFQENNYTITVTMAGPNRFEFTCKNMEAFRIFVNDQMIDFSRPVTVTLFGRPKFSGIVTPSVAEMLADQLFLGRGFRYYTGVIEIDFSAPSPRQPASAPAGATP